MKKISLFCALGLVAWAQALYAIDFKKVISVQDSFDPYSFVSASTLESGGILVTNQHGIFLWPDPNGTQYQTIFTAPQDAGPVSLLGAVSSSLEGNLAILNHSPGALDNRILNLPHNGSQSTVVGNFPQPVFPDFQTVGGLSADDAGHVAWRVQTFHDNALSSEVYVDGVLVAADTPNSLTITSDPALSDDGNVFFGGKDTRSGGNVDIIAKGPNPQTDTFVRYAQTVGRVAINENRMMAFAGTYKGISGAEFHSGFSLLAQMER